MLPGHVRDPSGRFPLPRYGRHVPTDPIVDPTGAGRDAVLDAVRRQARSCAHLGSPVYAALLGEIADDVAGGGSCAALLGPVSERPVHDAVPLRLLAATHLLALRGDAPELAAHYPSCGGAWDGEPLLPALLAAVEAHGDVVADGLARNVQTNEIGRMAAIVAGSIISL